MTDGVPCAAEASIGAGDAPVGASRIGNLACDDLLDRGLVAELQELLRAGERRRAVEIHVAEEILGPERGDVFRLLRLPEAVQDLEETDVERRPEAVDVAREHARRGRVGSELA